MIIFYFPKLNLCAIYPVTGKKMTVSVVFLKKCVGHSDLCGSLYFNSPLMLVENLLIGVMTL